MKRLVALAVMVLVVGGVAAAQDTKTASGTVKAVAGDSLTITDKDGKDMTFAVDGKTELFATGGSHKTADTKAMGKKPVIADVVKTGAKVSIEYHDMGGKMHAAKIRVL